MCRIVLCRRFEVPTPPAASLFRNFKSKSGTRIITLLVPLCFPSSCQRVPRCITNFGSGALGSLHGLGKLGGERPDGAVLAHAASRRRRQGGRNAFDFG